VINTKNLMIKLTLFLALYSSISLFALTGQLAVSVFDPSGKPVSGAQVSLFSRPLYDASTSAPS
jgi:hypothetical protein